MWKSLEYALRSRESSSRRLSNAEDSMSYVSIEDRKWTGLSRRCRGALKMIHAADLLHVFTSSNQVCCTVIINDTCLHRLG